MTNYSSIKSQILAINYEEKAYGNLGFALSIFLYTVPVLDRYA